MTLKTRSQEADRQRQAPTRGSPCRRLLLVLLALVVGGAAWALFELVIWDKLPAQLVGKWAVVEGPQEGATFDFYRNGTMVGRVNLGGKEGIINARVVVEGDTLLITTQHPTTKLDDTKKQTIKTLNAKELVLQDERGNVFKMERADE
jgi:uncharacterized protein (TIGR03066 family)